MGVLKLTQNNSPLSIGGGVASIATNGNFANGTTGWAAINCVLTSSSNIGILTGDGTLRSFRALSPAIGSNLAGRKIYIVAKLKVTNAICEKISIDVRTVGDTFFSNESAIATPDINTEYTISAIATVPASNAAMYVHVYNRYADAASANTKVMQVREVMAIDMGSNSGNLYYNFTVGQMDSLFPLWLDSSRLNFSNSKYLRL